MSTYVVLARFDAETDRRLNALGEALNAAGYATPEWPPHITIAAYENIEESTLYDWTEGFAAKHSRLDIGLHSLNILPPGGEHTETAVLCLAPSHSKPFVDFYYAFHEKHEAYCTGIGWYNSITHGNPVMHATLGIIPYVALQKAIELCVTADIFGSATIEALELYAYPMRLIKRFELANQK